MFSGHGAERGGKLSRPFSSYQGLSKRSEREYGHLHPLCKRAYQASCEHSAHAFRFFSCAQGLPFFGAGQIPLIGDIAHKPGQWLLVFQLPVI